MSELIKCNKCGYVGSENEFPKGHDFFQMPYISRCPNCDNSQNPGDASMRMFGGKRPFSRVKDDPKTEIKGKDAAILETLRRANNVS